MLVQSNGTMGWIFDFTLWNLSIYNIYCFLRGVAPAQPSSGPNNIIIVQLVGRPTTRRRIQMKKILYASLAIAALVASPALAADMRAPVMKAPVMPAPIYRLTGCGYGCQC